MNGIAVYILGAIFATVQGVSAVAIWYLKRNVTKAQAALTEAQAVFTKAQAANETAEATQTTANSFNTLTETITKMATDFSGTLMKTIELVNSRETRIDELESGDRQKTSDLKELRGQLNDAINANVQRDTKIELQQKSIDSLATANTSQAKELIEVKAQMYTLQTELKKKDEALLEKDKQILRQDERIKMLEARVANLEKENTELKKPVVIIEEKAPENQT